MDSGFLRSKRSAARRAARESRRAPKSVRPCPGPTRPSPPPETRARAACRNPPRCARSAAATGEARRTRTARGGATRLRSGRPTRAPTSARRRKKVASPTRSPSRLSPSWRAEWRMTQWSSRPTWSRSRGALCCFARSPSSTHCTTPARIALPVELALTSLLLFPPTLPVFSSVRHDA